MSPTEYHPEDQPVPEPAELTPVPITGSVKIDGDIPIASRAADYGAYAYYSFAGTENPVMVLPYDPARSEAILYCNSGTVNVGSLAQATAYKLGNTLGGGFLLPSGATLTLKNKQPLYMVPTGSTVATVSVVIERWDM